MAAITWRNVDAPSMQGVISNGMNAAQAGIDSAVGRLQSALDAQNKTVRENWDTRKDLNTQQMAQEILRYSDPTKYMEAVESGAIADKIAGMGAQVDSTRLMQMMDGRLKNLQEREMTNNAFADAQRDRAEKPILDAVMALKDAGRTKEARVATDAYLASGLLSDAGGSKVSAAIFDRDTLQTKLDQAAESHKANLTHLKNQDKIAQGNLGVAQQNARTHALQAETARVAAAGNLVGQNSERIARIDTAVGKQLHDLNESKSAFEKGSPFGGGTFSKADKEHFLSLGKKLGASNDAVSAFLDKIQNEYGTSGTVKIPGTNTEIPLTKGMVEAALVSGLNKFGSGSFAEILGWDSPRGGMMMDSLKELVASPGFADKYAEYQLKSAGYSEQAKQLKENGATSVRKLDAALAPYLNALQVQRLTLPTSTGLPKPSKEPQQVIIPDRLLSPGEQQPPKR